MVDRSAPATTSATPPIPTPGPVRYRIRFHKTGSLRFISHQDLLRTWERILRRAALPLRFTSGFHAKPRISSPLPLALGLQATDEIFEFDLDEQLADDDVERRLRDQAVAGLQIAHARRVQPGAPRARVVAVEYTCVFDGGISESDANRRRDEVLAADAWVIERRIPGKPVRQIDIRPKIDGIAISGSDVVMQLRVDNGATVRPEEVLAALELGAYFRDGRVTVTRTRVELG